jgi:uncharacterized protein (TIGR02391 family)
MNIKRQTFEAEAMEVGMDFLDLIDGNLQDKSKYIRGTFGINVPYTSYEKQWNGLINKLGLKDAVVKILKQYMEIMTVREQEILHKSAKESVSQQEAEFKNMWRLIDYKTHKATKLGLFVLNHGTDTFIILFDRMQFHPKIIEVSRSLFETGHHSQAIFESFKAIISLIKEKTGRTEDGRDLMAKVFNENAPIIKFNNQMNQSEKDEQEGFKLLFMGAMVGIRNPKAHDNYIQKDPNKTLEYLAFADLLMKKIEEAMPVKSKRLKEETFIDRCRKDGHEKSIYLYTKIKTLKDSRFVNGDSINWGTSGYSYHMPWKGKIKGETLFVVRSGVKLQVWTDFLRYKKGREVKQNYWGKLRNIPIIASQFFKQKNPTVSIDEMENTELDAFVDAVRELGNGLDKI